MDGEAPKNTVKQYLVRTPTGDVFVFADHVEIFRNNGSCLLNFYRTVSVDMWPIISETGWGPWKKRTTLPAERTFEKNSLIASFAPGEWFTFSVCDSNYGGVFVSPSPSQERPSE